MTTQLITRIGPYYESDGVAIYHGDGQRILPTLSSDSVDFVLTSRGQRLWPKRHRDRNPGALLPLRQSALTATNSVRKVGGLTTIPSLSDRVSGLSANFSAVTIEGPKEIIEEFLRFAAGENPLDDEASPFDFKGCVANWGTK